MYTYKLPLKIHRGPMRGDTCGIRAKFSYIQNPSQNSEGPISRYIQELAAEFH